MRLVQRTKSIIVLLVIGAILLMAMTCEKKVATFPEGSSKVIEGVTKNKVKVSKIPPNYLNNKLFILELISKDVEAFNDIPKKYYDDFDVMKKAVNIRGSLAKASDKQKDNKRLAKIYIAKNGENLQYVSDRLKGDPELINLALKTSPQAIKYAAQNSVNKEIIIAAINQAKAEAPVIYAALEEKYKMDREIILASFKKNYRTFDQLPDAIKNDENFVIELVVLNPQILNSNFTRKTSPTFHKKIREKIDHGEIQFDEHSQNHKIGFLNLVYFSKYAKDDGMALHLKLRNGSFTQVNYLSSKDFGDAAKQIPTFWGYVKDLGFYIVSVKYWEGSEVFLIDDISGKKLAQIHDYPVFSPDRKFIVYANSPEFYNFAGIEIFAIKNHEVKSVYMKELRGFAFDSWSGNDEFLIKAKGKDEFMTVFKTATGWDSRATRSKN